MRNLAYFLIIALFASGCSVSSRCVSPDVELPNEVVAGMEADSMCIADLKWYDIFADPCLVELIEMTIENNKDLLAAWSKVEELERLYRVAKSDYFPSLDAEAYVDHETNDKSNAEATADLEVSATLTLSWELDLFGRVRWNNRQALANYLKSVEGQRALQLRYATSRPRHWLSSKANKFIYKVQFARYNSIPYTRKRRVPGKLYLVLVIVPL